MNPKIRAILEQLTSVVRKLRGREKYIVKIISMQCETETEIVVQALAKSFVLHKQMADCIHESQSASDVKDATNGVSKAWASPIMLSQPQPYFLFDVYGRSKN